MRCTASGSTRPGCRLRRHHRFTVKGTSRSCAGRWQRCRRARARIPRRQGRHGLVECRSIKVVGLDEHPAAHLFPHATRTIKGVRFRRRSAASARSTEIVHAVTSLTYRQAHPALLAKWIRGHWSIENAVHHLRDATQSEDSPASAPALTLR
jgi:hypothetical protein